MPSLYAIRISAVWNVSPDFSGRSARQFVFRLLEETAAIGEAGQVVGIGTVPRIFVN